MTEIDYEQLYVMNKCIYSKLCEEFRHFKKGITHYRLGSETVYNGNGVIVDKAEYIMCDRSVPVCIKAVVGIDPLHDQNVALNIKRNQPIKNTKLETIYNECNVLKTLSPYLNFHPNIMGYYTNWSEDNVHYAVVECIEGYGLNMIPESEQLLYNNAYDFCKGIKDILNALKHIHEYGMVHRDIRPENIMYDKVNERYVLIDFGVTCMANDKNCNLCVGQPSYILKNNTQQDTENKMLVLCDNDSATVTTDIYALTITFLSLYIGVRASKLHIDVDDIINENNESESMDVINGINDVAVRDILLRLFNEIHNNDIDISKLYMDIAHMCNYVINENGLSVLPRIVNFVS
jgi:serine/threonine protein kinase